MSLINFIDNDKYSTYSTLFTLLADLSYFTNS